MTRSARLVLPALLGGLLIGVFAGARFERANQRRIRREGPNPEKVLRRFRRELALTDAQTEKVRGIMAAHKPEFAAARKEGFERVKALRAGVDREIEAILDETQKSRFVLLKEKMDRKMREEAPPDAPR